MGPAFVAGVAYVDPGNVAANTSAGARYGTLLVWVLVAATAAAALVQHLSARLGLVTGHSLPELVGARTRGPARVAYWLQAELAAVATDLAEVVGGAVALALLFHLPVVAGAAVTAVVSSLLLLVQQRRGPRPFERVVVGLLAVVAAGFLAGLAIAPPDAGAVAGGLLPRLAGSDSVVLAAAMLGATVMPHAVYVHSALARDRHGHVPRSALSALLRATRTDIVAAMALAGAVNVGLLLVAATALRGASGVDTLAGVHAALGAHLGGGVALLFALGLLASGLASTAVGGYAGGVVMSGLLQRQVPVTARRLVTVIPAVVLLGVGVDPTAALVVSQVVLCFGIPFALVPLVRLGRSREVAGEHRTGGVVTALAWTVVAVVVALNVALLALTLR
ncbi:MAG TPA: Nramp family divalent metal transporter [Marmoricola sp.]|nr:Nramp family divalent metal transporter [Marmoricola sp.]